MEIRPITSMDLFPMMRIISKIGVDKFKKAFESVSFKQDDSGNVDVEAVGFGVFVDIIGVIVDNLPNAENEIYDFLASVTGQGVKTLKNLPPADFLNLIVDVVKRPEFKDFFSVASKLVR